MEVLPKVRSALCAGEGLCDVEDAPAPARKSKPNDGDEADERADHKNWHK